MAATRQVARSWKEGEDPDSTADEGWHAGEAAKPAEDGRREESKKKANINEERASYLYQVVRTKDSNKKGIKEKREKHEEAPGLDSA